MVKQLLSCYYLHTSFETFILRVGFISFDVDQIIVDNGDIAQTHTQIQQLKISFHGVRNKIEISQLYTLTLFS